MERRKNAAAYITSLWAVKKIQKENSGIEITKQIIPKKAGILGFLNKTVPIKTAKKIIS